MDDGFHLHQPEVKITAKWSNAEVTDGIVEVSAAPFPQAECWIGLLKTQFKKRRRDLDQALEHQTLRGSLLEVDPEVFPRFMSLVEKAVIEEVDTAQQTTVLHQGMVFEGEFWRWKPGTHPGISARKITLLGKREFHQEEGGRRVHAQIILCLLPAGKVQDQTGTQKLTRIEVGLLLSKQTHDSPIRLR